MISRGAVRYILVDATSVGAGATSAILRPDDGKQWRIMHAIGFQTDAGAPRACAWYCTDPATSGAMNVDVSLASGAALALGGVASGGQSLCHFPLKATRSRYYTFLFNASAAAQHGYIYAVVEEFTGIWDV